VAMSDVYESPQKGLLFISRGTAILLLGVYVAYLIFQLKTHTSLFNPVRKQRDSPDEYIQEVEEEETPRMSVVAAGLR
jgi:Ca2+:H+ antiporter